MFVKAETRNRFTGNNTDRQQSSAMGRHKSRSSANDIRRSSTSKDGTWYVMNDLTLMINTLCATYRLNREVCTVFVLNYKNQLRLD